MVGPDDFMKLTGEWAFLGSSFDRHIEDYRWTSTRNNIYDSQTGNNFKKVVVEWEFLDVG